MSLRENIESPETLSKSELWGGWKNSHTKVTSHVTETHRNVCHTQMELAGHKKQSKALQKSCSATSQNTSSSHISVKVRCPEAIWSPSLDNESSLLLCSL